MTTKTCILLTKTMQIGLVGEMLEIYTQEGLQKVDWRTVGSSTNKPLTWYKVECQSPCCSYTIHCQRFIS